MVILHIVAPAEVGGLERVVQALAIGHRRLGYEVAAAAVLTGRRDDHPFLVPMQEAGVAVIPIVVPARAYLRERRELRRWIEALHPDVVHTHGYRPDVVDAPVARQMGIPTVSTVHGFTGGGLKKEMYERLQRRALRDFDAVVAVSRAMAEDLVRAGVPAERLHLLPNAWMGSPAPLDRDLARRELGVPRYQFHLGWVGRLSREKGPDVLLEAIARLPDIPLLLSVFGDGPELDTERHRAEKLGIERRIRWHGMVPEVSRFYSAFDAFVLSSRTEGTPIVLFEAMAARAPIIAAAVGGVPEVVGPAEACLVPPGDPAALAAAIRAVHNDPASATRRARAAYERLSAEHRVAPWLSRHESLYRRVRSRNRVHSDVRAR